MDISTTLLVLFSLTEVALLGVVILFFIRLRKSEALLNSIQSKQEEFVNRLHFNAQLENEMVSTFEKRQVELASLGRELDDKISELNTLIKRAENYSDSPQLKRQIIIAGHKKGRTAIQLAKETGLGVDEVELIIDQA